MPILTEVVTGLLSSIVYDGIKRPCRSLAQTLERRRAIGSALSGTTTKQDAPSQLLADLAKIIGNETGLYTDQVASFLTELDRSSIPDALHHLVLCNRSTEKALGAFEELYASCAPLPFTGRQMFDALVAAIKIRIQQAALDPLLLEAVQAQSNELSKQMDTLEASLERITTVNNPLKLEEVRDIRLRIAKSVEAANRSIPVETTQGTRKVSITKLAIPARLQEENGDQEPPRDDAPTISFLTFRRAFHRAAILGDPGGGKSTLTQNLCFTFAHQISLESENPNHSKFHASDLRIPIKVVIRSLEKRQQKNPSYSILDYIEDDFREVLDNDKELAQRFIRHILNLGQAVVLFDGLDEVLNIADRRTAVEAIERFATNYATCPVLVTSRIVGYRDAPLASEFVTYTLAQFNREEITKFSEKLISAIGNYDSEKSKQEASSFVRQTETVADDLRKNPLLLGLMVYIFVNRGDVPNNRPEIYKECSLLMFEKWDQRRDIIFQFPADFDLLDLFGYLASKIFGNVDAEDGVEEVWLVRTMRSFFEEWYEDKAKALAAARILVTFITGRAWVMCDVGPSKFKFTHRTFLEYFVARRLEEESGSIDRLLSQLFEKIKLAQWDVVSHLALQIATFRSTPKSIQAFESLQKHLVTSGLNAGQKLNLVKFVSKALEYLSLPEAKFKELVRATTIQVISAGETMPDGARDALMGIMYNGRKRKEIVSTEVKAQFQHAIEKGSQAGAAFCATCAGWKIQTVEVKNGAVTIIDGGPLWDELAWLRQKYTNVLFSRAQKSLLDAQVYWYVFEQHSDKLYLKYGYKMLSVVHRPLFGDLPYRFIKDISAYLRTLDQKPDNETEENSAVPTILAQLTNEALTGSLREVPISPIPARWERRFEQITEEIFGHLKRLVGRPRSLKRHREVLGHALISLLVFIEHNALTSPRGTLRPPLQRSAVRRRLRPEVSASLREVLLQMTSTTVADADRKEVEKWINAKGLGFLPQALTVSDDDVAPIRAR